jgi:hypothetical protein
MVGPFIVNIKIQLESEDVRSVLTLGMEELGARAFMVLLHACEFMTASSGHSSLLTIMLSKFSL